ncbi:Ig-like domain-containing protein [Piscinibacter koreensis]|uniref:Ig-like domain-containing protein n=1 Tax=Piscinibacter koreensis TaxID=2742824 RepID=A0A7Y6NQU5_9BURK|nr:Ig-like domain-containing protein [Schlegelella koreensis]NUZ07662.1 Ig-like domain-containing protein [Schlegelella koreensis]
MLSPIQFFRCMSVLVLCTLLASCGGGDGGDGAGGSGGGTGGGGGSAAAAVLVSISIAPVLPATGVGIDTQLVATATYSDATTADVTAQVQWSSSAPNVARVNAASGLVTGVALGRSTVTARSGTLTTSTDLMVTADRWTPGATMLYPHVNHMAIVLRDGRVLVAGGGTADAELYDPVKDRWSPAGRMTTVRTLPSASLLGDGKVLVTGGFGAAGQHLASSEIFDPTTATWSAAGAMSTARFRPVDVTLPDGKVLFAGGAVPSPLAELFDPVLGSWSAAGSLTRFRYAHSATLLPDGRVLVVGGLDGGDPTIPRSPSVPAGRSEIFDPVTLTWSLGPTSLTPRFAHRAIAVAGGGILVLGGGVGANTTAGVTMAELFDPVSSTWLPAGTMTRGRYALPTATRMRDGRVIVTAGGFDAADNITAEAWDPATRSWRPLANMSVARDGHAAVLLTNGKLLVTGGFGGGVDRSVELYW